MRKFGLQASFYGEVIRDKVQLVNTENYIENNVIEWKRIRKK
jgi:hypothetical protein